MEIHETLDELVQALESARAVPMSASCMVNRSEMLALLDKARRQLPADLTKADALLADAVAAEDVAGVVEQGGVGEVDHLRGHRRRPRRGGESAARTLQPVRLQPDVLIDQGHHLSSRRSKPRIRPARKTGVPPELDDASHGCPKPDGSVLFSNPSVFPTVINENMLTRRAFSGASVATHDQAIDGMSR